jgi:hypothetical protein
MGVKSTKSCRVESLVNVWVKAEKEAAKGERRGPTESMK